VLRVTGSLASPAFRTWAMIDHSVGEMLDVLYDEANPVDARVASRTGTYTL
jgi:hypothetical protein